MDKLKIVKTIVCLLTFLLVFGTLALLGGIYKKTQKIKLPDNNSYSLDQPTGSMIADYNVINENIYFFIKDGGLPDRLLIYDSSSGKTKQTIYLSKEKKHD